MFKEKGPPEAPINAREGAHNLADIHTSTHMHTHMGTQRYTLLRGLPYAICEPFGFLSPLIPRFVVYIATGNCNSWRVPAARGQKCCKQTQSYTIWSIRTLVLNA